MVKKRSRKRARRRNPATGLTDDLIVEILSRLPSRPLCRAKCVSRRWRDLISDPNHRKRLLQTLAGVFYLTRDDWRFPREARHFASLRPEPGRGPLVHQSLSFLPGCERLELADSCNGLLLCRCFFDSDLPEMFRYMVCNPATETWLELPVTLLGCGRAKPPTAYLAFDPAISSHFHVFEFAEFENRYYSYLAGAEIYSSRTRVWTFKRSCTTSEIRICTDTRSVFFNGILHLVMSGSSILAVDTDGETWRIIRVPYQEAEFEPAFIGQSQGHLYYTNTLRSLLDPLSLSIWVLEDYSTDEWIQKHLVSNEQLSEKGSVPHGIDHPSYYNIIAIHPDCSLIFYVTGKDNTLMKYDIDRKEVHVIRNLGSDCCWETFLAYVPLYLDTLKEHQ